MEQGAADDWFGENEMVMDSVDEAREGRIFMTVIKCMGHP